MNTIKYSMIAVVVVEKDAPVAGPAFEAALQYLEKNQGAKVGRLVLLCGSKIILSKSGQNFSRRTNCDGSEKICSLMKC